jgi:hypothetical protein
MHGQPVTLIMATLRAIILRQPKQAASVGLYVAVPMARAAPQVARRWTGGDPARGKGNLYPSETRHLVVYCSRGGGSMNGNGGFRSGTWAEVVGDTR